MTTAPRLVASPARAAWRAACLVSALGPLTGCAMVKTMAVNNVASMLAAPPTPEGDVFSRENDPRLVRDAVPFALKFYETLLESVPKNQDLLLATCGAFTQYAYAFVQGDVDFLESTEYGPIQKLNDRALNMYGRARGYCLRALELRRPGIGLALQKAPDRALVWAKKKDVPLLYWTAAAWGSQVSLGLDQPGLVLDLPAVRALFDRALALDESYSRGAIHAALISFEARPEMGGSVENARKHFARAVELSRSLDSGPYVTLAMSVSLPARDRAEFVKMLEAALAIDADKHPSQRLVTLLTQMRATRLLERVDELFGSGGGRRQP